MSDIEIGDRVAFKTKGLPKLEYHGPGMAADETATWADHFGGVAGVVDGTDPVNNQVRVRGRDTAGDLFTIWIEPRHLTVTEEGIR